MHASKSVTPAPDHIPFVYPLPPQVDKKEGEEEGKIEEVDDDAEDKKEKKKKTVRGGKSSQAYPQ